MSSQSYKINPFNKYHQNQLFYLHSTAQQQSSQKYYRFKTERTQNNSYLTQSGTLVNQSQNQEKHSSLRRKIYATQSIQSVNSSHSQQKIHYFQLDLKNIITKSRNQYENESKLAPKEVPKDRGVKDIMNKFINKLNQVQNSHKKVNDINDLSSELQKAYSSTSKSREQEIENLFPQKNQIKRTKFHPKIYEKKNQHIKIQDRITTKQQFELKYKKLNMTRKRTNMVNKQTYRLQQKCNLNRNAIKNQLETKRIQKMIIDKNGYEYKVTIQRLN